MRIIHCLWDDKFMNGAIELFETDKRHSNEYYYVSKDINRPFQYIKSEKARRVNIESFLKIASSADVVILHSLSSLSLSAIYRIPASVKVVWFIWGFDFYGSNYPVVPLALYMPDTLRFKNTHKDAFSFNKRLRILFLDLRKRFLLDKALARIDYFSGVYPYEYDLLCQTREAFHGKPLDFYYGSLPFFIKDEVDLYIKKPRKNVIVGNSGDPTNNHYEALTAISSLSLDEDGRIIIPLSYNATDEYKTWIRQYAEQLFPGKVNTLESYLPFDEYSELVSGCRVAIYNHIRQQASDNILMQMLYGAKVYLSEASLAFDYFKGLGLSVFSLESDVNSINIPISDEEIYKNRRIISSIYGESSIIQRIIKINDCLSK